MLGLGCGSGVNLPYFCLKRVGQSFLSLEEALKELTLPLGLSFWCVELKVDQKSLFAHCWDILTVPVTAEMDVEGLKSPFPLLFFQFVGEIGNYMEGKEVKKCYK